MDDTTRRYPASTDEDKSIWLTAWPGALRRIGTVGRQRIHDSITSMTRISSRLDTTYEFMAGTFDLWTSQRATTKSPRVSVAMNQHVAVPPHIDPNPGGR